MSDPAQSRYFAMVAVRFAGVALILLGILVVRRVLELPDAAGYLLLILGLAGFFVMPTVLARRWRSPKE
ncbi:hypothetical protein [Pelagerythrobacter rhizovicinus]|uniref:Uncharacterized protein n=1 Tax=Pelagerythrobacter rhizovicinus TaxID=2268576 RepID=A0A4Q2KIF0_9SPHN|nr:hypothetical protein [Pelagerythrobacter rhizovicinus]RXZ64109.1 hypothetical protein ETX26_09250 [Pelagerythrobacter rhizovicinus]